VTSAPSAARLPPPPWPFPERLPFAGRSVSLEPLGREHMGELWRAAQGADAARATAAATPKIVRFMIFPLPNPAGKLAG
jgi:hypothetical protein